MACQPKPWRRLVEVAGIETFVGIEPKSEISHRNLLKTHDHIQVYFCLVYHTCVPLFESIFN
ncbi:MAG: hypothetical protein EG822_02210 [Deltaproteobacteria bacterium]|nr:hypothetical protein [Deltaproteobacteria bacterium]TLN04268.1 MAG: hypothetical protein FDZ73_04110 [bacterium]